MTGAVLTGAKGLPPSPVDENGRGRAGLADHVAVVTVNRTLSVSPLDDVHEAVSQVGVAETLTSHALVGAPPPWRCRWRCLRMDTWEPQPVLQYSPAPLRVRSKKPKWHGGLRQALMRPQSLL